MLIELNPKHGFEVWINQKLVEEIETAFKKALKTEELHYYYCACQCHKGNGEHNSKTVWVGKISLIDFIKKVQKIDNHFCAIGVTNAKNKKDLEFYFENELHDQDAQYWDYWIGDSVKKDMVCGDSLFITLWDRVRNKATKESKTRKKFFFE